jgi:hypothetical protein
MKRVCNLCLGEYPYKDVKKFKHGLNLCDLCYMIIIDITERKA